MMFSKRISNFEIMAFEADQYYEVGRSSFSKYGYFVPLDMSFHELSKNIEIIISSLYQLDNTKFIYAPFFFFSALFFIIDHNKLNEKSSESNV